MSMPVSINDELWILGDGAYASLEKGVIPDGLKHLGDHVSLKNGKFYIFSYKEDGSKITEQEKKDAERYCKAAETFLDKKDNYSELKRVLEMAYSQAAEGKGKERHANGEKFEDQPIMTIAKGHGLGYQTGQAAKKLQEAHTLLKLRGKHAAIQEILGAINYAAAAVLLIEQMEDEGEKK